MGRAPFDQAKEKAKRAAREKKEQDKRAKEAKKAGGGKKADADMEMEVRVLMDVLKTPLICSSGFCTKSPTSFEAHELLPIYSLCDAATVPCEPCPEGIATARFE